MAVIVELTIGSESFGLGRVAAVSNGVRLGLECVVQDDRLVDDLATVVRIEDRVLYEVNWGESTSSLTRVLTDSEVTVLEARGNNPWPSRLRFNDHAALTEFHNHCQDEAIEFHVERIYTLAEGEPGAYNFNITDEQRETLVTAVSEEYSEVPRRTTLNEVAGQLGISPQTASERVRRGAGTVLRKVLLSQSAAGLS